MAKRIVIYTRFTDPKQREESHEAQERKVRQHLDYLGIGHANALVLRDSATRGDLEEGRACYEQLLAMINRGEVALLAVDQQSRFSRGFNVRAMVQDLVFVGGRFLTAAEGIDTDRPGWQDLVGIKEIHNQMEIRDTGWRVRRSQEQRVEKPNGSAGDYPYGYTSEYDDPAAAANYRGRGPKPAKHVVIEEAAAQVVREVFERFAVRGQSIGAIVRWWEANKARFPAITKTKVHHQHVRRILTNKKYIGTWEYGRTTTLRDSGGKKKQVKPYAHQKVTVAQRPELRIVSQELWDQAQRRLAKLQEVYGMREGGRRRGPSQYYKLLYAKRLIDGLVHCGDCIARGEGRTRLHTGGSNGVKRMECPRRKNGVCPVVVRVPYAAAERAVDAVIQEVLGNFPAFLSAAVAHMRDAVVRMARTVPAELEAERKRLAVVDAEIRNVVRALAGGAESPSLRVELARLESEKASLEVRIAELVATQQVEVALPDDAWVRGQMADLGALLREQSPEAIQQLRSMIGRIVAEEVQIPGKKRGYVRIRFRIDGWAALIRMLAGRLPESVLKVVSPAEPGTGLSEEFVVDLGAPTAMDSWGPHIVEWRKQKVMWHEIARRTGLKVANAYVVWRRWKDHRDAA
jgi:site-specific DNA recombinase